MTIGQTIAAALFVINKIESRNLGELRERTAVTAEDIQVWQQTINDFDDFNK